MRELRKETEKNWRNFVSDVKVNRIRNERTPKGDGNFVNYFF